MNTKIQSIHFDADSKLEDFVHEKVSKLQQFYEDVVSIDVYLRLEKSETQDNKVVEIRLHIPGKMLFAKEQNHTFEMATEKAMASMTRQVKREKEKARGL